MTQHQRIVDWANNLTGDQAKELLVSLIEMGINSEDIAFWSDAQSPYWRHTGDPLVEGQKPYSDD